MNIAIDAAGPLSSSEKGGISYFLGDFLSTLKDADEKNRYLVFGYFWRNYKEKKKEITIPDSQNFRLKTLPLPRMMVKNVEERLRIPVIEKFLVRENVSIFHSISAQEMPYFRKIKSVYSIYDLACEINPEWYKDKWYSYVRQSALRADTIITTSFFTKRDIIRIYGINPEKVKVVYLGVNRDFFNTAINDARENFREKYNLPDRFILAVATSVKRKNIPLLLNVYRNLLKKGIKEKLVVVAGSKVVEDEITEIVKDKNISGDVVCLSEVSTDYLAYLYKTASLFVFPSLYEGFGIPVVEAMACGCPVIISNVSSLPEIGGDAVVSVDPYSEEEIRCAIEKVLADEDLRNDMRRKGLERAKLFSWSKTVQETLRVYADVLAG